MRSKTRDLLIRKVNEFPLPDCLQQAVIAACVAMPPLPSVNALAHNRQVTRRWLDEQWRQSLSGNETSLKVFLNTLQIIHALEMRNEGTPWKDILKELGVSESTLRRRTARFLRESPARITQAKSQKLLSKLESEVLGIFRGNAETAGPGNVGI